MGSDEVPLTEWGGAATSVCQCLFPLLLYPLFHSDKQGDTAIPKQRLFDIIRLNTSPTLYQYSFRIQTLVYPDYKSAEPRGWYSLNAFRYPETHLFLLLFLSVYSSTIQLQVLKKHLMASRHYSGSFQWFSSVAATLSKARMLQMWPKGKAQNCQPKWGALPNTESIL